MSAQASIAFNSPDRSISAVWSLPKAVLAATGQVAVLAGRVFHHHSLMARANKTLDQPKNAVGHFVFLHMNLAQSYQDLVPDVHSDWDRDKILRKIDIIVAALVHDEPVFYELTYDVDSKDDRSKLVTLVLGLKYRLMERALINLEPCPRTAMSVERRDLFKWIASLSALQRQLLMQTPLVVH